MKLNINYYDENLDKKEITEEFEEVYEKVMNYEGEDFSQTLDSHSKIKNILALSDIRENILNWYDFKENASILEMNANYGEITGLLCKNAKRVVSIEASKKYAQIIEKRHKNKDNLELIVGELSKIELQEKFDYIVIIGIANKLKEELEYAKKYIKEDGIIFLAVNNKFGVKAWITSKEEEKVVNNSNIAISRKSLEKLLEGMNYEYYYPLPNYKLPNIIYTSKTMPSISNIYRDLTYKDEEVNFKEVEAFKEIIENNPKDFENFANSFLLEISNKKIEDRGIRFITFSNIRKDEYRIKTIIKEKEVYKTNVNEKSKKHIEKVKENIETLKKLNINILDSFEDSIIISKYTEAQTLADKLIEIYLSQGKEAFISKLKEYEQFIKEKLQVTNKIEKNVFTKYKIECDEEKMAKLTFVKYGFWDLIFQNCFIINDEYYFYDQEWIEENVPIEYIMYRAILYWHESKKYISDNQIFEELGIIEYEPIFKKLDDKIQQKTRKQLMWNIHTKEELEKNKYKRLKQELLEKQNEITNLKNELEHERLENKQKDNQLVYIKNSFSWKVTKPLRAIKLLTSKK